MTITPTDRPLRPVGAVLLLLAALLMLCAAGADAQSVRVEGGQLAGTATSVPGVRAYLGVPYAAPPVGERRWRPPAAPDAWAGVRAADHVAPSCMQVSGEVRDAQGGARHPWTPEFMVQNEPSEDCLYVNVWTTAGASRGASSRGASSPRPVLVWLHGGGFNEGSGAIAVYDGARLAAKGLVVVAVNYRLRELGFLAHPELTRESPEHASGNYGLLDAVAALRWVRRNAAAFGGDPARVTVAGQSAGAMMVHALTASPLAAGLFHRAIAESGSLYGRPLVPLADAEAQGSRWAEAKGARTLAELRALPARDVIAGVRGVALRNGPVVDGWFLPRDVMATFAAGAQNDVPTLTGLNADEGSAARTTYGKMPADSFRAQARQRWGELADDFLRVYPAGTDAEAGASQVASARDQGLVSLHRWAADRARTARTPVYTYYCTRALPWPAHPEYGAVHPSEVPYVFGTLDRLARPWTAVDRGLSETMMSYWARFAAAGDPNDRGLPAWPRFDAAGAETMELGERVGPRLVAEPARLELLARWLARP